MVVAVNHSELLTAPKGQEVSRLLEIVKKCGKLSVGNSNSSKYRTFLAFDLDTELLDQTGCEVGALNEQFKGVFGWMTRTSRDQILCIEECGKPILAVADVLKHFHHKYPNDNVIKKWGVNIAAGAQKVYSDHGVMYTAYMAVKSASQTSLHPDSQELNPDLWRDAADASRNSSLEAQIQEYWESEPHTESSVWKRPIVSKSSEPSAKRPKNQSTLDIIPFHRAGQQKQEEEH
ncbi:hypothetical protein F5I97DRAFT_1830800 [Phlebopus sp. FC_14]|nr:hypothetical protein F5I97DRAFT_1830800 [Phlebopus sp. FC_14]